MNQIFAVPEREVSEDHVPTPSELALTASVSTDASEVVVCSKKYMAQSFRAAHLYSGLALPHDTPSSLKSSSCREQQSCAGTELAGPSPKGCSSRSNAPAFRMIQRHCQAQVSIT